MTTSKQCPNCGAALFWAEDIGSYCTSCGWKQPPKQAPATPQYRSTGYVPGTYSHGDTGTLYGGADSYDAPSGFNWGAFLVPFWWCMGMRLWGWAVALTLIPLIGTIGGVVLAVIGAIAGRGALLGIIIVVVTGPVFLLVSGFYLGAHGNELAWHSRPFDSVEQFMAVQRTWAAVGIVVFLATIVLNFVEFKMLQAKVEEASQELQMPLR